MPDKPAQPNFEFFRPIHAKETTVDPADCTDTAALQLALREAYADMEAYRELVSVALTCIGNLTAKVQRQADSIDRWFHPTPENDECPHA